VATLSYNADASVLQLRFPYDRTGEAQALAKTIPGWKWAKRTKSWDYPATIETARTIVTHFDPDVGDGFAEWWARVTQERAAVDRAAALRDGDAEAAGDFGFVFHTKTYQNQLDYCEWAATRILGGILYRANHSDPGAGKTKSEIDMTTWEIAKEICQGVPLVFAPNSVLRNWVAEIYKHAPPNLYQPIIIEGSAERKLELLQSLANIARRTALIPVAIINYEVLSQPSQRPVLDCIFELADQGLFGKLILDESTAIKNTKATRGKEAYKLSKRIPIRVTMTGTPYSKHLTDIFNQMRVMSPEILGANWTSFFRYHAIMGGWQNKQVVGYAHEEELREKVSRHAFRRLLSECTDLPDEIHTERYCDLSSEQRRATAEMKEQYLAELSDEGGCEWMLTAANALTRLLRFNQITSGFLEAEGHTTTFSPNPKLKLLLDIIRDEVDEGDKGVIWCCYQHDVVKIKAALEEAKIGCTTFYGPDTARTERPEHERRFKEDSNCRFMIATPDAGGWGLNWQVANWCIFYSYGFKAEAIEQAKARIRRIDQEKRMLFTWLVAENPAVRSATHGVSTGVNRYILDNLAETSKMAKFMTGDYAKEGIDPRTLLRQAMEIM
jgi:SNF2 family DNA or RNA helicase